MTSEQPSTWRIVGAPKGDREQGAVEEVVFTVRGIVCDVDLPPVLEKPS
jgi:hypothetical protein